MPSLTETSDALKANLQETAVDNVTIADEHLILCELVSDYRGIHKGIEELLLEISHPFRNWTLLLPRLRAFVLKNSQIYCRSDQGPAAFGQFSSLFLQVIEESTRNEQLRGLAVESLLAYVERFLSLIKPQLPDYQEVLDHFFETMAELDDQAIMFMVQGHHPMKKMATNLLEAARENNFDLTATTALFHKILSLNYSYWLSEEDPLPWFQDECGEMCTSWEAGELFSAISHERIYQHLKSLDDLDDTDPETLEKLLALPAHMDIVRLYKDIPDKLIATPASEDEEAPDRFTENRKLIFLFKIMNTSGLYLIHEESLREINRSLVTLIHQQSFEEIESFLLTTMQLLKENVRRYPHTALQCIQVLGTEAFQRGSSRLAETFLWEAVRFGFQYANVSGVDEEWQPITNPAHLANIRAWLHLIMQEPKWCATLFSALIINVNLSGTCVKDTDLFQRDITNLLNHPIEPVYNLVKQFSKLMPVFFNEIGAEGKLRDVSTEIDETHKRKDILIHFLRKQSHVESSNLIVGFIQAIMRFWRTLDKSHLTDYLPAEILSQVKTKGVFVDQLHKLTKRIFQLAHIREEPQ